MSLNKYKPHVWVLPEDDANRQLANGFLQYREVNFRSVQVTPPAGGWLHVLEIFEKEFVQYLRNYRDGHVVMLIDFDEQGEGRRSLCEQRVPDDLKQRVFLLGTSAAPEALKKDLNLTFERVGEALARDCGREDLGVWSHPHLAHNHAELLRMGPIIHPIVLPGV